MDTDSLIAQEQKKTIAEIFATDGEAAFRDMETACLQKLLESGESRVISVGGGLPANERNHALLRRLGSVIYLRASADTIYGRVKNDTARPLLQGDDPMGKIRELMRVRAPLYEAAADAVIEADGKGMGEIVEEIIQEVGKR